MITITKDNIQFRTPRPRVFDKYIADLTKLQKQIQGLSEDEQLEFTGQLRDMAEALVLACVLNPEDIDKVKDKLDDEYTWVFEEMSDIVKKHQTILTKQHEVIAEALKGIVTTCRSPIHIALQVATSKYGDNFSEENYIECFYDALYKIEFDIYLSTKIDKSKNPIGTPLDIAISQFNQDYKVKLINDSDNLDLLK